MPEPRSSLSGMARKLHRYSMRWEGTNRHVDVVLAADVEDLEFENGQLREDKMALRDLLRRAYAELPLPSQPRLEALARDVKRAVDRG